MINTNVVQNLILSCDFPINHKILITPDLRTGEIEFSIDIPMKNK